MKIIKNTLECRFEREDGTQAARYWKITGELVVQLTDEEIQNYEHDEEEVVKEITLPLFKLGIVNDVKSVAWLHELANDTLTLTPNNDEM